MIVGYSNGGMELLTFDQNSISWQGLPGRPRAVIGLTISGDGKLFFIGTAEGSLEVWDADQLRGALRTFPAHKGGVRALAASPDGKLLVSSGADNTVRLWETETGKVGASFKPARPRASRTPRMAAES